MICFYGRGLNHSLNFNTTQLELLYTAGDI